MVDGDGGVAADGAGAADGDHGMVEPRALTVVIPTRERWAILARTLAALAAQTAAGFRTIVAVDGLDQAVPESLRALPGVTFSAGERGGPGVARNRAAAACETPLLLFLGDDMLPEPQLTMRHLIRHGAEPDPGVAVLGHVRWHPEVSRGRVNRWLEWSGTQFDYGQLARERGHEAGFGRFYSCNVSLKRELFDATGGFDPEFELYYEDLDFGWRAGRQGMRLRYEPGAVALHLHRHDLGTLRERFTGVGAGERLMAAKHPWFSPWYLERIERNQASRPASRLWPAVVELVPESLAGLRARARAQADVWYHQQLAQAFQAGWGPPDDGFTARSRVPRAPAR